MAVFPRFTNYEPTGKDGLYRFQDSAGGSRLLFGTAAEQAKAGIDRNRQSVLGQLGEGKMSPDEWNALYNPQAKPPPAPEGGDQRTAEASLLQRGRQALSDAAPALSEAGARGVPVVGEALAPVGKAIGQGVQRVLAPPPPPAAPGKAAPPAPAPAVPAAGPEAGAPAEPKMMWAPFTTNEKGEQVQVLVYSEGPNKGKEVHPRGTPGAMQVVSPARAGSPGRKGGMMPSAMTVQGGFDPDEDYLGIRSEFVRDQQMALEQTAQAESGEAQAAASALQQQAGEVAGEIAAQQKANQDIKAQLDGARSALDAYTQQINTAQIDPNRIYRGEKGARLSQKHRIAGMFGAFGSTLAKSPNYIAASIAQQREADIAAQEKDLLKKTGQRDTALQYFTQLTGSLEAGKQAVRKLQNDRAIVLLNREAAKAKDAKAKAAAIGAIAALDKENADFAQAYLRDAAGQVSKSFKYVPGTAGTAASGPRVRLPTSTEVSGAVGTEPKAAKTGDKPGASAAGAQAVTAVAAASKATALMDQLKSWGAKDPALLKKNMNTPALVSLMRMPAEFLQKGSGYRMPIVGEDEQSWRMKQDFEATKDALTGIMAQGYGKGAPSGSEAQTALAAMEQAGTIEELLRAGSKFIAVTEAGQEKLEEYAAGGTDVPVNPTTGAPYQ